MRLTLKQARDNLYKAVVPDLSTQERIDTFNQTLNFACERLINSGAWLGQFEHVAFLVPPTDHHITLPPQYISVQAMAYQGNSENCGCTVPVQIRNQWMALLSSGPFLWDWGLWSQYGFGSFNSYANDKGDGFCTFRNSPFEEYTLRFELDDLADIGKTVLVKGFDEEGLAIYTPESSCAYQGITFTLSAGSTSPSQVFSRQLYFLQKEECFQGYLKLYAVEVGTGTEVLIGQYEPSEINPDYKRYAIPNCERQDEFIVRTICKRRFVPMLKDTDLVVPAQFGALRTALTAIVYEGQNDPGRRDTEMAKAIDLLNDELRSSRGGAMLQLNVNPSAFDSGSIWGGY